MGHRPGGPGATPLWSALGCADCAPGQVAQTAAPEARALAHCADGSLPTPRRRRGAPCVGAASHCAAGRRRHSIASRGRAGV